MNSDRSLFVGHGAPTLATSRHPANTFLRVLGETLPKPRAVVIVSPHWMAPVFAVKAAPVHEAWHDFGGFPRELYALRYAPRGEEALADRLLHGLTRSGIATARDRGTRIDHGVWVPLMLMWPQADVPIVQIAVGPGGPSAHWRLGEALRSLLRDEPAVLLIGSGSIVHNLNELGPEDAPTTAWAAVFDQWLGEKLVAGDRDALVDYRRQAPQAARAHPTEEHLLPLFVAAGAAQGPATRLHQSFSHGSLSLSAYGFA